MGNDFAIIFELCFWVLQQAISNPQSIKPTLVRSCLKTFQAFLSWIPLAYIFDTELVPLIINNFLTPTQTRIEAIRCITEIASLSFEDCEEGERRSCKERNCLYYCHFIQRIAEITHRRSLADEYQIILKSKQQSGFENFAKQLALSISAVLKNNIDLIESMTNTMEANENIQMLQQCVAMGLDYMVQLSNIDEDELFKICLDFWHFFSYNIMIKTKGDTYFSTDPNAQNNIFQNYNLSAIKSGMAPVVPAMGGFNFGINLLSSSYMHNQVYPQVLESVRIMAIDKMAKPKEVLVTQDEFGEVVEEVFDDIETNAIYETMREMLIYLTNIDCAAMDRVIQRRLDQLTGDKSFFSFERLNKLCWALGSVSGCMSSDDENKFVVSVIKELLNLCEKTSGKSNKALVAADIMYVVG